MAEPSPPATVSRSLPLLLATLGLAVSGVLEWIHIKTYLLPSVDSFCSIDETFNCGQVALSRLSVVAGVPMPIWGAAGFLAMMVAAWKRLTLLWPLAAVSALISVGLLLESVLHVGAVCLMCEVVHLIAVVLAIVAWRSHRRHGSPAGPGTWFSMLGVPVTLLLCTAFIVPRYWAPYTWQTEVPHAHGVTDEGLHWVGAENPSITVEEFVDYGCPHCAVATNITRRRLASHDDELRVVRRHQPRMRCTEINKGCIGVRSSYCAHKQGKYWEMDAWLFANMPGRGDVDVLEGAKALGLDEPSFVMCLQDPATFDWANKEAKAARLLKVIETPTYRVDGKKMMLKELDALLSERL